MDDEKQPKKKKQGGTEMIKIDFDPKRHQYLVNGEVFPSVTQILSIIDKSGPLVSWAANITVKYIQSNLQEKEGRIFVGGIELSAMNASKILQRAKKEHSIIKNDAADIGRAAHAEIEKMIRTGEAPTTMDPRVCNAVKAYMAWAAENAFLPQFSERRVCLISHKVAGTVDCVGQLRGKRVLIDFKTSNSIYPEMELQVAAYVKAWEETYGSAIEDVKILRIGKDKAEFECHSVDHIDQLYSVFLSCIPVYRWIKEVR